MKKNEEIQTMNLNEQIFDVCDLHCDTILKLREEKDKGISARLSSNAFAIDAEKLVKGNVRVQTFALFTDRQNGHAPEYEALRLLNEYQIQLECNADTLIPLHTRHDLNRAVSEKKTGALLSLEEGDVMYQDLELLEFWYRMGVRMIALTWNYPNAIAHPNISFASLEEHDYRAPSPLFRLETEHGLTEYGKAYVRKCEELGILVDVSHLGDKAFWDLMEIAKKPVIASHSNCRELCKVSRNLDDDQIRAIAKTGGVIGLNFCADFLKENTDDVSHIEDMVRHLNHLKEVGGIDVCAIGTDFDGINSTVEIHNASEHQKLAQSLLAEGWSEEDVRKAMGGNFIKLLERTLQ